MGMRDGAAYLAGLRDGRRIYHNGALVADVTAAPGFANTARTLAAFYDFQCDPALADSISYLDEDGERSHLAFLTPRSKDDLRRRAAAFALWAEHTGGQMGRAPDYMNSCMMYLGAGSHHWGSNDPELGRHAEEIAARLRREDALMTHTFITPQIDRSRKLGEQEPYLNAGIVKRTADGIVVRGARIVGTMAPFADENTSFGLPVLTAENEDIYALGFNAPVDAPGLHWVCRDSYDPDRATEDYPLSGRFEEMDTVAVFDDVEVPWEQVFDYRDIAVHNAMFYRNHFEVSLGHHVIVKNVAKARFMLGIAHLLAETLQTQHFINIQIRLGDMVMMLETMESIAVAAVETGFEEPRNGVWYANPRAINAGLRLFPEFYVRMVDHIKQIGGSGFMAAPSAGTIEQLREAVGPVVDRYFSAAGELEEGIEKVPLFRLAWDAVGTAFAGRQELYERFFFGDQQLGKSMTYQRFDKSEAVEMVRRMLDPSFLKE